MTGTFWTKFQTQFAWGLDFWRIPPLLIVATICMLGVVVCLFRPSHVHANWRRSYWLVLTQLLFYPLAIAIGCAFQAKIHPPTEPLNPNRHGEHLLDALTITSLVTAAFWVYYMKGLRWLAVSLVILQETVIWGALFVAGMSVSGDWI
jgi:hypothetical protein